MLTQDHHKLQKLIVEYGHLHELREHTEQTRGQRFNHFIAELLQSWGIKAFSSIRSSGEIDVGFEFEGRRFVVEAKWEQKRTYTGQIAKLQKRLRQRLGGTVGLFISMSGYTPEALRDLKEGEQLAVLCLEREHLEAMISGVVPPEELLNRVITRASLHGEGHASLLDLFDAPSANQLGLSFEAPTELSKLVEESVPGFEACVSVSSLPLGHSGVASLSPDRILLTLTPGIFEVDPGKQTVRPWLPIPDCSRNVLLARDGAAYIPRRVGVACFRNNRLTSIGGGLAGNVTLFEGVDGAVWAFANGDMGGYPATLTRLGQRLGDQRHFTLTYSSASGINAAQIDENRFLIVGSTGVEIARLDSSEVEVVTKDLTNPMGLGRLSSDRFVVASGCAKPITPSYAKSMVCLSEINTTTKTVSRIAQLNLTGSISEIAMRSDTAGFLFSHYSDNGIVVQFEHAKR